MFRSRRGVRALLAIVLAVGLMATGASQMASAYGAPAAGPDVHECPPGCPAPPSSPIER